MRDHRHKRRRILIDRLQLQLLGITVLYFVTAATVFAVAIFAPLVWTLNVDDPGIEQASAASEFLTLHQRFWPALLVTFALLSAHSVLTSHRIVGPLYRFRAVFGEIQRGNLGITVGLRRRDFLLKEADALNRMIVSLREGMNRMSRHGSEARRLASELERALQSGSTDETRRQLADLQQALTDLEGQISRYSPHRPESDDVEA